MVRFQVLFSGVRFIPVHKEWTIVGHRRTKQLWCQSALSPSDQHESKAPGEVHILWPINTDLVPSYSTVPLRRHVVTDSTSPTVMTSSRMSSSADLTCQDLQ